MWERLEQKSSNHQAQELSLFLYATLMVSITADLPSQQRRFVEVSKKTPKMRALPHPKCCKIILVN